MKLTDEQIEKAVSWWSNIIQKPKFDNGDKSNIGAMTMMLAVLASDQHQITQEQVDNFRKSLKEIIERENGKEINSLRGLSVDYHPDGILSEAAENNKISHLVFPCKTHMFFRDGKVLVSCGYCAKPEEL